MAFPFPTFAAVEKTGDAYKVRIGDHSFYTDDGRLDRYAPFSADAFFSLRPRFVDWS